MHDAMALAHWHCRHHYSAMAMTVHVPRRRAGSRSDSS